MLKLGVIGTSWITVEFIKASQMTEKYELYAVYSRNLDKAKQFTETFHTGKAFDDLGEMLLEKELDVVYIASPNSIHYEQAKQVVEAGKHVIVEKPAFSSLAEWQFIHEKASEKQVYVFEAARHIHIDNYHALKDLVEQQKKEAQYPFMGANFSVGQYSSKIEPYWASQNGDDPVPNIFNPTFKTGSLMDMGVYPLYVALDLFGEPTGLDVKATKGPNQTDLVNHIYLEYPTFTVGIFVSKAVHSNLVSEIYFDNKVLTIDNISMIEEVTLTTNNNEELEKHATPVKHLMYDEADHFAKIISQKVQAEYQSLKELSYLVAKVMEELTEKMK